MTQFDVSGMTCGHCAAAVTRAIQAALPGAIVTIDLAGGRVGVAGAADPRLIRQAIADAGYTVR